MSPTKRKTPAKKSTPRKAATKSASAAKEAISQKTPVKKSTRSSSNRSTKQKAKKTSSRTSSNKTRSSRASRRVQADLSLFVLFMRIVMYATIAYVIGTSLHTHFLAPSRYYLLNSIKGMEEIPEVLLLFGLISPDIVSRGLTRSKVLVIFGLILLFLYILSNVASSD